MIYHKKSLYSYLFIIFYNITAFLIGCVLYSMTYNILLTAGVTVKGFKTKLLDQRNTLSVYMVR